MNSSSGFFSARIWFYDLSLFRVECWSDGLDPMNGNRSISEWAHEHLCECHDAAGLREILEVPAEGDYQVFFKGKMRAWLESYPSGEWDEEFEIVGEVQKAVIPKDYADIVFYNKEEKGDVDLE